MTPDQDAIRRALLWMDASSAGFGAADPRWGLYWIPDDNQRLPQRLTNKTLPTDHPGRAVFLVPHDYDVSGMRPWSADLGAQARVLLHIEHAGFLVLHPGPGGSA